MIDSDIKSQSYAHLMVFNKNGGQAKMAAWISTKKSTAMGLDMPHLVWKFYEKSCFSVSDMARKRKKWTKNNNNNNN